MDTDDKEESEVLYLKRIGIWKMYCLENENLHATSHDDIIAELPPQII
jgi:hypothetical protein